MVLACVLSHDPTGGCTLAALTGATSLSVPGKAGHDSMLIGYALDGISVNECTITCPADERFPTAGMSLRPTGNGTATARCKSVEWLDNPIPMRAGEAITHAGTSGANDMFSILYFDVEPFNYVKPNDSLGGPAYFWTRATAASGTNLTALTVQTGLVTLKVYDVAGKLVRVLVDAEREANHYQVVWDGRNDDGARVASGVYFYRLSVRDVKMTKKLVLLK